MKKIILKATYDSEVDAAYIYFTDAEPGIVTHTYGLDDQDDTAAPDVNIDTYDDNSKLLGVEILGASGCLPEALLVQLRTNLEP